MAGSRLLTAVPNVAGGSTGARMVAVDVAIARRTQRRCRMSMVTASVSRSRMVRQRVNALRLPKSAPLQPLPAQRATKRRHAPTMVPRTEPHPGRQCLAQYQHFANGLGRHQPDQSARLRQTSMWTPQCRHCRRPRQAPTFPEPAKGLFQAAALIHRGDVGGHRIGNACARPALLQRTNQIVTPEAIAAAGQSDTYRTTAWPQREPEGAEPRLPFPRPSARRRDEIGFDFSMARLRRHDRY
jgi:hypothetical protein